MARYAQVHSQYHYIANVVEWNGDTTTWAPPTGFEMIEDPNLEASPGGTYEDGQFILPPAGTVPGEAT